MKYQLEDVAQVKDQIQDLLQAHWQELATDKELMVLKPDWDRYAVLEQAGVLYVLTARTDSGELVGYHAVMIDHNLHYSDMLVAVSDVLFLHPDYRQGRAGLRLIDLTEEIARNSGAVAILWRAKPNTTLDRILRRRKATAVQDISFLQRL